MINQKGLSLHRVKLLRLQTYEKVLKRTSDWKDN